MNASVKQNLLAFLVGLLGFIGTYNLLKWPIWVATLVAIGLFLAIYLLATPVLRIGQVELEQLKNGTELKALYDASIQQLQEMRANSLMIQHDQVKQDAQALTETGESILSYLEAHPREISSSRHFLDYYLTVGNKLLQNFVEMEEARVSDHKLQEITHQTQESLDILNEIYSRQRDGYHLDRMRDLEVETELLEKTLKLGGGYSDEE